MANMTTVSNPPGRWWHPLPLMSGVGLMIGFIIMKLTGEFTFSWWFTILFPLISDILFNLALVGIMALCCWISDIVERRKRRKK